MEAQQGSVRKFRSQRLTHVGVRHSDQGTEPLGVVLEVRGREDVRAQPKHPVQVAVQAPPRHHNPLRVEQIPLGLRAWT